MMSTVPKVSVIDYGMSNLLSVTHALEHLGCEVQIISTAKDILRAQRIVFPGVGAFPDAIKRLNEDALSSALIRTIAKGVPILGICLGMQLLFAGSDEWGKNIGLSVFPDWIVKMDVNLKTPHMGWNQVNNVGKSPLLKDLDGQSFYFVHSYWATDIEAPHAVGLSEYGSTFVSVAQQDNVFGVQFHPEKSSAAGLMLLKNFICL
ncbi:MAG: imidazole glycerol phosphate synthase subunit HisH [Christensenellales bacterium]|jgi:glutamine amidotransferase